MSEYRLNEKKEGRKVKKEDFIIVEEENAFYELDLECLNKKKKQNEKKTLK